MEGCRWPPLAEPYASALRGAVSFLFASFEPLGIVATGTIIRGNPAPTSDLDLYVLHRDTRRQRLQRFFNGVPAEIFVNPPEQVERYFAEERRAGRPVTAHMLATGFVVFDADPVIERLRARAAEEIATPPGPDERELTALRYGVATNVEDAEDVLASDPEIAQLLLSRAVDLALRYRFAAAGQWQPRQKELLSALATLDRPLAVAVRGFLSAPDPATRRQLAREIAIATAGATGFFEWESELRA